MVGLAKLAFNFCVGCTFRAIAWASVLVWKGARRPAKSALSESPAEVRPELQQRPHQRLAHPRQSLSGSRSSLGLLLRLRRVGVRRWLQRQSFGLDFSQVHCLPVSSGSAKGVGVPPTVFNPELARPSPHTETRVPLPGLRGLSPDGQSQGHPGEFRQESRSQLRSPLLPS